MAFDIRARLISAEKDLIDSFDNLTSLEGFKCSWQSVLTSLTSDSVDEDITILAQTTASHVAVIANGLMELHAGAAPLRDSMLADIDSSLQRLSFTDPIESCRATLSTQPPPLKKIYPATHSTTHSATPPYIAPAYKWLVKNIRNPYPSKETKELISRGTGTSLQNVDAWFLNARRRIGWTNISKKYFNGSKVDTVAAAFRALKDDINPAISTTYDEEERIPLPANIQMAFVEMEDAARRLYSEKFTKSELAGTLDRMVKDMTDDDRKRRREERKKEKALEKLKAEYEREDRRSRDEQRRWKEAEEGYPSPSPEPESLKRRFETSSSMESEDEVDLTPPVPIAGRKRASTEDSGDEKEVANTRPVKRSRILSSSSSYSSIDSLSSISRQNSIEPFPLSPSSTACSTPPPSTPSEDTLTSLLQDASPKRKRRLSDADVDPLPKRPMPLVRPRLQIVSDPLPKSAQSVSLPVSSPSPVDESAVVDWSQFFAQPFMAVTDELDTTGPIQMNMFDYSQFADYASSGETSDGTDWEAQCQPLKGKSMLDPLSLSSSPAIHVPSLAFTDFDLPAPVSVIPDFELDFCATMGWPHISGIPGKSASSGSTTLEDSELNNLDGLSSLASLPPYQPAYSSISEQPSHSDETAFGALDTIDWSSIIPQTIPPTQPVEPTAIAPATIKPTAYLGSSAESRAEKLRKYQEHLAQARRLQEELAFI